MRGNSDRSVFQTTAQDRNGNVTAYSFNQLHSLTGVVEQTNRNVRADEPAYTTAYVSNADYLLLQQTLPEGNTVAYGYDSANPDRLQQGRKMRFAVRPRIDQREFVAANDIGIGAGPGHHAGIGGRHAHDQLVDPRRDAGDYRFHEPLPSAFAASS